MKTLVYILAAAFFLSSQLLFAQADKKLLQTYTLLFHTTVNGLPLSTDSIYQNHWNETYRVRSFKYYVSHIRLVYNDGKIVTPQSSPRLISEADSSSGQIKFFAPKGNITCIQFLLGIDSITNVSGVQSDDLDPAKGMFWIWNTGYIMAKLEGSSPSSKAPGKQYSYDIGGYKPGESAAREISLSLAVSGQPPTTSHQPSTFLITADVAKWFYGKHDIKISGQPMCHAPGTLAMQVADNYADMFSIRTE